MNPPAATAADDMFSTVTWDTDTGNEPNPLENSGSLEGGGADAATGSGPTAMSTTTTNSTGHHEHEQQERPGLDNAETQQTSPLDPSSSSSPNNNQDQANNNNNNDSPSKSPSSSKSEFISVTVDDPIKELDGSRSNFVSYRISGSSWLPQYTSRNFSSRRRFQDFKFLRDNLCRDFPACVVPPLPDKHRMEYLTGDRFSSQFVERRRIDLQRFLSRLARHPTLSRSTLLQAFLESSEWSVHMHQHVAHPPSIEPPPSILDNLSDTFLNAFSKVRKPDERFVEIKESLEKFEESLNEIERIQARARARIEDLSTDYEDFASSFQGLGYLESGITEQLSHFEGALSDFAHTLRETTRLSTDPFLQHLHSLLAYSIAFKNVLKVREQKQMDFEDLTTYLSSMTSERDRLASGYNSSTSGLGSFLKGKADSLRGAPPEDRETRMVKLDSRIKELQEAVTSAHDVLDRFNAEVLNEQKVFQQTKRIEMKELLDSLAESQINLYNQASSDWDKCIPALDKINTG